MPDYFFVDFESYSEANLKKAGAVAYSLHPSTDIICMAWAAGAHKGLWTPGQPFPSELLTAIR